MPLSLRPPVRDHRLRLQGLQGPQPHRANVNRIKQFRHIATPYNKTAASYLGFLALVSVKLWTPTYVNGT
jgi:transposase